MQTIKTFLHKDLFWSNDVYNIILAIIVFCAFYIVLPYIKTKLIKQLKKITKKTKNNFDDFMVDLIDKIRGWFYFVLALFAGTRFLHLPEMFIKWLNPIIFAIVLIEVAKIINKFASYAMNRLAEKNQDAESAISFLAKFVKMIIWALVFLFFLQNLGVNITSLVAGLGISGIAVALALQTVLGDLFSSFAIFLDKPFKNGDYIAVGSQSGTVQKVGIKTTRIESLTGEEIIISNSDLTASRIQNFKRMKKRRGNFTIGVEYGTPLKKLKMIPGIIHKIGEKIDDLEIDRVCFFEFGDSSLNFEIVFWVLSREFTVFRELQEEMNFAIIEAFEKDGIKFAFPTRTVHVVK